MITPFPLSQMRVFAVPRSMAISPDNQLKGFVNMENKFKWAKIS